MGFDSLSVSKLDQPCNKLDQWASRPHTSVRLTVSCVKADCTESVLLSHSTMPAACMFKSPELPLLGIIRSSLIFDLTQKLAEFEPRVQ